MSSIVADSYALQAKYGFNHEPLDSDKLAFRLDQIEEEQDELVTAFAKGDAEGVVDALVDIVVFSLGTLAIAGVDVQKAWDKVHAANMAKERGVKKGREQSGGWDLIKPKDWRGPEHGDNTGFISDIFASRTMS